jgi:hypothetical protein
LGHADQWSSAPIIMVDAIIGQRRGPGGGPPGVPRPVGEASGLAVGIFPRVLRVSCRPEAIESVKLSRFDPDVA